MIGRHYLFAGAVVLFANEKTKFLFKKRKESIMNRKLNKKGFTIVELVIVIAVVAILAAVLIPTFVGLVNQANVASDTAVAKNMNNALATYSSENGVPETFEEVLAAIEDAGYVLANLNAKAAGNLYAWDKTNNQIVYIAADGSVIYQNSDFVKDDLQFIVADSSVAMPDWANTTTVVDMTKPAGAKAFKAAIAEGKSVTLQADITLGAADIMAIEGDVKIDLNGYKLDASLNETRPFNLTDGATLTIDGGDQEVGCGLFGLINVPANTDANIVLNGGVYTAETDNGSFIKLRPGEGTVNITLNDVNYTDASDDGFLLNTKDFTGALNLTINGGDYTAAFGFQTRGDNVKVDGVKVNTQGVAFVAGKDSTIEITNSEITTANKMDSSAPAAGVATQGNGTVTISDSKIITEGSAYCIYSSGGTIIATNNEVTGNLYENTVERLYDGQDRTIAYLEVDGEVLVDVEFLK